MDEDVRLESEEERPQSEGQQEDVWPKSLRDAWLRKWDETDKRFKSLESTLSEIRELIGRSGQQTTTHGGGAEPLPEDLDIWDDEARRKFVSGVRSSLRKMEELEQRLNELHESAVRAATVAGYIPMQVMYLQQRYPGIQIDLGKVLSEAARLGTVDLDQVVRTLYADQLRKMEEERLRKEIEEELQKKMQAQIGQSPFPSTSTVEVPKEVPRTPDELKDHLLKRLLRR